MINMTQYSHNYFIDISSESSLFNSSEFHQSGAAIGAMIGSAHICSFGVESTVGVGVRQQGDKGINHVPDHCGRRSIVKS